VKLTVRGLINPTGRHRAVPHCVPSSAEFERLLADGQIAATELASCPGCRRTTAHALNTDGSRTCWTCRTTSPGESQ
jgi:hypothetical protein